jgi:hypothetical protein
MKYKCSACRTQHSASNTSNTNNNYEQVLEYSSPCISATPSSSPLSPSASLLPAKLTFIRTRTARTTLAKRTLASSKSQGKPSYLPFPPQSRSVSTFKYLQITNIPQRPRRQLLRPLGQRRPVVLHAELRAVLDLRRLGLQQ